MIPKPTGGSIGSLTQNTPTGQHVTAVMEANGNITPYVVTGQYGNPSAIVSPTAGRHGPAPGTGIGPTPPSGAVGNGFVVPSSAGASSTGCSTCDSINAATGGHGVEVVVGLVLIAIVVVVVLATRG